VKHNDNEVPHDLEPIPELGYEEPWEHTPFQKACIAFAEAFASSALSSNNYTFNTENHISIPLLSAEKVSSRQAKSRPNAATHFGMLIGPQGFAETAWMNEGVIWRNGDSLYLRHPAELAEIIHAHAKGPFSEKRADFKDLSSSLNREEYFKAFTRLHLSDTPTYEAELDPQYTKIHQNLSDLIEDVFVLLEEEPYKGRLLPLAKLSSYRGGAKLLGDLEELVSEFDRFDSSPGFPFWWMPPSWGDPYRWEGDLAEFQLLANQIAKDLAGELPQVSYHDVVLGFRCELTSVQLLGVLHDHSKEAPKFILRPNRNKVSLLRFLDLLTTNVDPHEVVEPLAGWRKKARDHKTEIEESPLDQIRASIGFRQTIQRYSIRANVKAYDALCIHDPEKDDQRLLLTLDEHERRIHSLYEAYAIFHKSGYKQLLAPPEPRLPHFLEIAYQRFSDSSNERSVSAHCRNLLNLLGRTLLFFMLEDVAAAGLSNKESEAITEELRGSKAPSDGRLLDFQIKLLRSINTDARSALVTGDLMTILPGIIQNHLRPVVTKRNRANHPPFDEDGFIAEAREQLPLAIEALRKGFRTLEILVPVHFTSKDGKITVRAQTLTGHRFEYPERNFLSELGHEQTPSNTLLLCRVIPSQSQPPRDLAKPKHRAAAEPSSKMDQLDPKPKGVAKFEFDFSEMALALSKVAEAHDNLFSPRIISAVPLEIFFHKKTGYKEVIMTGVFDRISKEGPVFDYVEEDL
jgi:hypothetical protein